MSSGTQVGDVYIDAFGRMVRVVAVDYRTGTMQVDRQRWIDWTTAVRLRPLTASAAPDSSEPPPPGSSKA